MKVNIGETNIYKSELTQTCEVPFVVRQLVEGKASSVLEKRDGIAGRITDLLILFFLSTIVFTIPTHDTG